MRPAKAFLFHRLNEDGQAPVKLYLRIQGKPVRPNMGILVAPEDWDAEKMVIRGRSQEVKRKNLIIANKVAAANRIISEFELMGEPLTREAFLREWKNPGTREDFLEFYRANMERNYERGMFKKGTLSLENRTYRKLVDFSSGKIPFNKISRDWLEEFDLWHTRYLRALGFEGIGQREKSLKHIHKYLKLAKDQEDARRKFKWPFHGFKWPRHSSTPTFLLEPEIKLLIGLYEDEKKLLRKMTTYAVREGMTDEEIESFSSDEELKRVRRCIRWFLFQCSTGIRYGDLAELTWKNIQGDHLIFTPGKTADSSGKRVKQLIRPIVRRMIPPVKEGSVNPAIEYLHYDLITNQKYNQRLKIVAGVAGIEKRLTTHVGRHTFATYMLSKGTSLPVLQELLGVGSLRTLMIYVHVIQEQKDLELTNALDDLI